MICPTINQFLSEITTLLKEKNGEKLRDYLLIEPPLPQLYNVIISELKQYFPRSIDPGILEKKCKDFIPEYEEGDDGSSLLSFITFVVKYFVFLRDVDVNQLVETHDMLKTLLNQCILALGAGNGILVLPTVIAYSRTLAKLAIGLDKRPELVASLTRRESSAGNEEAGERITLVESTANTIREAFKKCLSERSGNISGIDQDGKPEGRRIGIYVTANLCLKLFFHCRKLRSAEQIFGNIYQQSPPLALYPASQRVSYLYYLGRYHFANNHYYRAQLALHAAYNQCHRNCTKQRRLILIYLIASNLVLGRSPKKVIFAGQEAADLSTRFQPLWEVIRKGDLASFRTYLDFESSSADWFLHYRILLQLRNRLEILVWRSLARRTFLLSGSQGGGESKVAPQFDLNDLLILATFLERRALGLEKSPNDPPKRTPHTNSIFMAQNTANGADPEAEDEDMPIGYCDDDIAGIAEDQPPYQLPTIDTIESTITSLVNQDLLHGFISHKSLRFAITGARGASDPVQIGFPRVWDVVEEKMEEHGEEVPGWVKQDDPRKGGFSGQARFGPGTVVNLSGAKPVGMGGG